MAGKIPQSFIDDVLSRSDIVDIVDERVPLKKTGKNYSACCPFHQEKSPSFTVSPDKQFYYCFGCGASGNALGFIMEYDRLDFRGAIESLAKRQGMEIPQEANGYQQEEDRQTPILAILEEVSLWYAEQLKRHDHRQKAIHYLQQRGLAGKTAAAFRIGFAPPGWDNVLKLFGTTEERRRLLIEAGLLVDKPEEGRCYDRFRDRIMFPIRNPKGKVIGFGGRVLTNEKPKYLNSPETPVFSKNKELYGFYEARRFGKKIERYLIVEGYMDVVMLAQYGLHEAVATLGTATSEHHIRTLFKRVDEIVFCFDGDNAGRTAAERALMAVLPQMEDGRQARFLFLPEGEDPDSLIQREGLEEFQRRINRSQRFSDFLFDFLKGEDDLSSMESRADLSKRALPLINQIPQGFLRQLLMDNLSALSGMDNDRLLQWSKEVPAPAPVTDHETPSFGEERSDGYSHDSIPQEWLHQPQYEHDEFPAHLHDDAYYSMEDSPSTFTPRKKGTSSKKGGSFKGDSHRKKGFFTEPREEKSLAAPRLSPCRAALFALIRSPDLAARIDRDMAFLSHIDESESRFLGELIHWLREHKEATFADLAITFDLTNNPHCRFLDELSEISFKADADDDLRYLQSNLLRLEIQAIEAQVTGLQDKLMKNIRLSEEEKLLFRDLPKQKLRLKQELLSKGT